MSSFINNLIIFCLLFVIYCPSSYGGRYNSFFDFINYRTNTTASKTKQQSISTTLSTATNKDEIIGFTLVEKIITALISSFVTGFSSIACVCVCKCYRNGWNCKSNWFHFKIDGYHQRKQMINSLQQDRSIELIEFNSQSFADTV